jgi:anhydro-N-acetylmuramic acid kinase
LIMTHMTTRWLIGLSCGWCAEGIDAVLLQAEGIGLDLRLRLLQGAHQPFGRELRQMLRLLAAQTTVDVKQLGVLHRVLGEALATAARQVVDQASFPLHRVQCLGCPGYVLCRETDGRFPSTVEVGMAAVVAERTGITTMSDFSTRDLAAGGQGVPVTALADYLLFRSAVEARLVVDLGSVARLVYLPANARPGEVLGFEAGPCGLLLDELMRQLTGGKEEYDAGGKHAVQGKCLESLLERWLEHPFLGRRPPRSVPRQAFGPDFVAQAVLLARQERWPLQDLLCTATHFVARCIASVRLHVPTARPLARIILSGGGVRNGLLWHLLEQQFAGVPLERSDQFGIAAEQHHAAAGGILAALTMDGVPANLPSATGAAGSRLLGSLTPGSPANWARCLAWMAGQTAPALADAA